MLTIGQPSFKANLNFTSKLFLFFIFGFLVIQTGQSRWNEREREKRVREIVRERKEDIDRVDRLEREREDRKERR